MVSTSQKVINRHLQLFLSRMVMKNDSQFRCVDYIRGRYIGENVRLVEDILQSQDD